jgi:hypothetical protein
VACSSSANHTDAGSAGETGATGGGGGGGGGAGADGGDAPGTDSGDITDAAVSDASDASDGRGGVDARDGSMPGPPCGDVCGTTLPVEAKHMIYDAAHDRLYVSIQGGAARYPNTITAIDPRAVAVTDSTPIGSDPDVLALSDDSSTLWVGMDGSFSMRKLTLTGATPAVGPLHMLPASTISATVYAQGLASLSGSPDTVVALATAGPAVAVYDDGVGRSMAITSGPTPTSIAKGPPDLFFGAESSNLHLMTVSATGIAETKFAGLVPSAGSGMVYMQGRLYAGSDAIDVTNTAAPARVGQFAFSGLIAAHSPNRLIMLSPPPIVQTNGQWELRLLETETFTQRGSVAIPTSLIAGNSTSTYVADLVYLGGDTVALLVSQSVAGASRLVIVHAALLANDGVGVGDGGGQGGSGGAGGTGGASGAGGTGGSSDAICGGCALQQLDVPAFHMTYDSVHARLYAVLTYNAPHNPNTLVSIDATSGAVLATVPIDSSPRQITVSDDGATLWVGFDSSSSIRKFAVATTPPVPGAADPLPPLVVNMTSMPSTPYDLAALPGSPTSIAACISGGTTSRVAILDDGVARPTIDASRLFISKLATGPAGVLFGYDGMSSAYTFASYAVAAGGVTLLSAQQGLMGVFQNDIHYSQGRVYADWGEVIDVSDPARPFRIGKYAWNGVIVARSVNRMMMLTAGASSSSLQLRILETDNFTQVTSLSLGPSFGGSTSISDLAYLGDDGVAFVSPGSDQVQHVFIFRSPTIGTVP